MFSCPDGLCAPKADLEKSIYATRKRKVSPRAAPSRINQVSPSVQSTQAVMIRSVSQQTSRIFCKIGVNSRRFFENQWIQPNIPLLLGIFLSNTSLARRTTPGLAIELHINSKFLVVIHKSVSNVLV